MTRVTGRSFSCHARNRAGEVQHWEMKEATTSSGKSPTDEAGEDGGVYNFSQRIGNMEEREGIFGDLALH
jgi:hypothetical protein